MKFAMVVIAALACGCALTSRGADLGVRYFTPEPARMPVAVTTASTARPLVRLGRVRGAPHLRQRIAYRLSAYEVGFYEDRQWTDRPEVFVERALERKLFEDRRFERATEGPAPTLDIEVVGFEELRGPGVHAARVGLRWQVQDDVGAQYEQTVTVDRPVLGPRFEAFVAAISEALDAATDRIADRSALELQGMTGAGTGVDARLQAPTRAESARRGPGAVRPEGL